VTVNSKEENSLEIFVWISSKNSASVQDWMASAKSQQGGVIFDLSEVSFPMLSRGEDHRKIIILEWRPNTHFSLRSLNL
jgi:hypothetical protein